MIGHFVSNHVILVIIVVALLIMFVLPGKRSHGSPFMGLYGCLTIICLLLFAFAAASAVGDYVKSNLSPTKAIDWAIALLPDWIAKPLQAAKNVSEVQKEMDMAQQLCLGLPFVKNQFQSDRDNNSLQAMYCQGQDRPYLPQVKTYTDAMAQAIYPFLASDPAKLNTEKYWQCLNEKAYASPLSQNNTTDCKALLQDPEKWRLCMELAIQVPFDYKVAGAGYHARLADDIIYCRRAVGY